MDMAGGNNVVVWGLREWGKQTQEQVIQVGIDLFLPWLC